MTGRRRLKRKGQRLLNMDIMIERNISIMEMQEGRDVMSPLVHLQSSHLQDTHLMRRIPASLLKGILGGRTH